MGLNIWVVIEMQLGNYLPVEAVMALIMCVLIIAACVSSQKVHTPLEEVIFFEKVIEILDKP
jgi:hypothetical protein